MSLVEEKAIEEAANRSRDYFNRQLYKLRYPIVFVVGSMSAFTLYQGDWIPFLSLNLISLCSAMFAYVLLVLFLGKRFLELIIVDDPKQFEKIYKQYNIIVDHTKDSNSEDGESIEEHEEAIKALDVLLKNQLQQEAREDIYKKIKRICWFKMVFFILGSYWTTVSIGSLFVGG